MALSSKQLKFLFASGVFKSQRTSSGGGLGSSNYVRSLVGRKSKKQKKTKFKIQFNPASIDKFAKWWRGLKK